MDVFIEKIIKKKKTGTDYFLYGLLFSIWVILAMTLLSLRSLGLVLAALLLAGLIYLLKGRNIEYEYAVTNGELDIDKIIAQRKRKRLLSANCKDFEIVARVTHEKFSEASKIENKIVAVSSTDSPDIYFIILHYNSSRTLVLFEPDERIIEAFKTYIPKKVFD